MNETRATPATLLSIAFASDEKPVAVKLITCFLYSERPCPCLVLLVLFPGHMKTIYEASRVLHTAEVADEPPIQLFRGFPTVSSGQYLTLKVSLVTIAADQSQLQLKTACHGTIHQLSCASLTAVPRTPGLDPWI
jgi:hypothetical protein